MNEWIGIGGGILGLIIIVFLVILGILWVLLPFAVFGVKDRLDKLIAQSKKTNALLESLSHPLTKKESSDPTVKK